MLHTSSFIPMTVLICHDTPDAIRGLLKRWFIEPKPNVFVGTVTRRTRDKTLAYIARNAPGLRYMMVASAPNCQGFTIDHLGTPDRQGIQLSGLWLVVENPEIIDSAPQVPVRPELPEWCDPENCPF
jgi:CRISPR-associated protein Cas2